MLRIIQNRLLPIVILLAFSAIVTNNCAQSQDLTPRGNAQIRSRFRDSDIVITTTERLAGAIDSLTWNGREFIDSFDHGRQLQSASNFDLASRVTDETFNPTEAGSRKDGAGPKSTSRLLHLIASGNRLQTTTQMAFWLNPGEKSGDNLAKNTHPLSNHLITKRITIGYRDMPNVIQYDVTFGLPINEHHTYGIFESVTGYMPPEFSAFWKYNSQADQLEPLDDGPGEQPAPIILATPSGSHAMGIYSPERDAAGREIGSYGRFRFVNEKVVKWNSVFRKTDPNGLRIGDYSFRNFVIVGDLETVKTTLHQLRIATAN